MRSYSIGNYTDRSYYFCSFNLRLLLILLFSLILVERQIMADDINYKAKETLEKSKKLLLDDFERRYENEVAPYLPKESEQDALLKESRDNFYKSKEGQILVFISSSMSHVNIKSLLEEAKNIGASILLRGFIDNSFKKTTDYIKEFYSKDESLGGILIDPASFKDFNVDSVPTFVLMEKRSKEGNKYKKLVGNITLSGAEELFKKNHQVEELGIYGPSFEIKEQDFEEMITGRLAILEMQGRVAEFNRTLAKKITTTIQNPPRVSWIEKAKKNHRFLVDVSKVITKDIKDLRGNVIAKKGTRVNPLSHTEFAKDIYFIDGDDLEQARWLKAQKNNKQNRIVILVGGSPIKLQEELQERMYFDLRGDFSAKFNISKVPSIVRGQGNMAQVEEIAL
jgi:conjugal transfer pilus assembly protein TraW